MGVSLSTVNHTHMAYDHGAKPKPNGEHKRENMSLAEEKAWRVLPRRPGRNVEHP
jgi:hypothetical protein